MLPASGPASRTRLTGIDAARGAALLGMIACHIMPLYEAGVPTFVGSAFSGRSAALFAVLAGLSLALYTGRGHPHTGDALRADRRGLAMRALVIAFIGFVIGGMESTIAIILVHYGVLFLVALPFAGMRLRPLALWASGWLLASPAVAYLVRPLLRQWLGEAQLGHNPVLLDLFTPAVFFSDIFFTGYYPVAQWLGYVLIGLAIGRLNLDSVRTQLTLLAAGASTAVAASALASYLMHQLGGLNALLATEQGNEIPLEALMQVSLSPVEQSGSWWWLAAAAPHSGTTLDLLHTSAVAAAVIGLCLFITHWNRTLLLPLSGAGAMTLTLYTAHVVLLSVAPVDESSLEPAVIYWLYAAGAMAIGSAVFLMKKRGPLEAFTSTLATAARDA
ncbi:heparan-alpha-glucosaminide N-acetyltransferase domain-containing protein [Arthrobacter castelli]|uniref:heparan-alpha-glucosaminide N-acetyltransferase domain-containing protein n=1 Tax=Arthrobacter castelli TaxID=271431 RepID=UPI00041A9741|nr:heparan-alpha-glucosaminide N-acetyltransferase domain-containing protein [Arthrobacter castelli]